MTRPEILARIGCAARARAWLAIFVACAVPGARASAEAAPRGAWVMSPGSFRLDEAKLVLVHDDVLQPMVPAPWPLLEAYRELSAGVAPQGNLFAWSFAAARRGIVGTLKIRF